MSFERIGAITFEEGEDYPKSAVIDAAGGYAYFGCDTWPSRVVKVRLSDFTRVGAITFEEGEDYLESAVIDASEGYAYFGCYTSPGKVVKVNVGEAAPTKAEYRAKKGLISGYHCFMKQYIDFSNAGLAPLKLPDGTLW